MADSVEQRIAALAITRLKQINGVSPYLTTLATNAVGITGGNVGDMKIDWDAGDESRTTELPAISLFQGVTDAAEQVDEGDFVLREVNFSARGFLKRGTDGQTARKLISDIMRAIRSDDGWVDSGTKLAAYTLEGDHQIAYAQDTWEVTGVEVAFKVGYLAKKFDMETAGLA